MNLTTSNPESKAAADANPAVRRVLVFASTFPSKVQPIHGVFVKERVRHVAALPNCDVQVVAPVPYFPPLKMFPRWYPLSQYGKHETIDGLSVYRPRYFLLPKFGKYFHARSMARAGIRQIESLRSKFDFDMVDSHFVYPDGVAAMHVARHFGKPLIITGRGEDVLTSPKDPAIAAEIREAVASADQLIAVSQEIADALVKLGGDAARITVIPNGVDVDRFQPRDQRACRRELNLPTDRTIIISVGYLLERKGFHLLAEATATLRRQFPDVLVLVVGGVARWGQDYTAQIEEQIQKHQLQDHVRLVGPQPPEELPAWYGAADLFALLTSREGCPNALLEALAAGLPAVATPIGQIPQVLADPKLGIVLPDRSVDAAVAGISQALQATWDQHSIRQHMEQKSWRATAKHVSAVFDRVSVRTTDTEVGPS